MASSPEESYDQAQMADDAAPDTTAAEAPRDNSNVPKPKRLACRICRRRKLRCDGVRPSCSTCSRLGHSCAYDEQRRKSGPKRGYVKALEERLKHVETLLRSQDQDPPSQSQVEKTTGQLTNQTQQSMGGAGINLAAGGWSMNNPSFGDDSPQQAAQQQQPINDFQFDPSMGLDMNNGQDGQFTWEMIGLGLEEPLPPQDTIDQLHQIYFEKIHPTIPMIHKYRYLAAMNLSPNQRPPVCLRYAMWTMACSATEKYQDIKDLFYQRARKYVEADYIKGFGEHMISVAHCQTHILLSYYEMKMMYFPRAWVSTGSAIRLGQMIGLHRLDGAPLDVKQCLPPPKDWTEREERRRTFWMAFCEDRYTSIGTGWPMAIDEQDIMTNLPASEDAFEMSKPEQTTSLPDATGPTGAAKLSSMGAVVLMACLFGRNLIHLHRPDGEDKDGDLNGPFWKRHRQLDNIILSTSLCMPSHLKLPSGISNPNVIFANMSIHTSTICLHQAAIFKAEKHKLTASVGSESKVRCITAANEIASIMRTVSHMDLSSMNPFISFCLYVSARVFVQYLKSRPDDSQTTDSLRFLLSAMHALKRRNPLTESFLTQLDVDMQALARRIPQLRDELWLAESPGKEGPNPRPGATCNDPDGVRGIMSYREKCNFGRLLNHSGRPQPEQPELVEPSGGGGGGGGGMQGGLDASNAGGFDSSQWLAAEQSMSSMTPSSGGMYDKGGSSGGAAGGSSGDNGGSADGQSNRPTPNSSTTLSGKDGNAHLGPTHNNSFQESPVSPQQNLQGGEGGNVGSGFFGAPGSGHVGTGFPVAPGSMGATASGGGGGGGGGAEQSSSFDMANGWGDMQTPATMAHVGDGVIRALMSMGPMDAMDLSSWDPGNENMRQ